MFVFQPVNYLYFYFIQEELISMFPLSECDHLLLWTALPLADQHVASVTTQCKEQLETIVQQSYLTPTDNIQLVGTSNEGLPHGYEWRIRFDGLESWLKHTRVSIANNFFFFFFFFSSCQNLEILSSTNYQVVTLSLTRNSVFLQSWQHLVCVLQCIRACIDHVSTLSKRVVGVCSWYGVLSFILYVDPCIQ